MAKRRDFIGQILDRRLRHPKRTVRWSQLMSRVEALIFGLHHVLNKAPRGHRCRAELLRHFPTAIIAASEGYFRFVYRDLIDFGDPYLRNAANFKDLTLGHEAVYAIHGHQMTIGEIIAHQLSHNRLENIVGNMDALAGGNFRLAVQQRLDAHASRTTEPTIASWVFKYVDCAFELRHICCHELAPLLTLDPTKIDHCFRATVAFLYCSESHVQTLLRRNA